jgi:hypothetical protein
LRRGKLLGMLRAGFVVVVGRLSVVAESSGDRGGWLFRVKALH